MSRQAADGQPPPDAAGRLASRRLKLALPFTVLTSSDTVRLVAGEDFRYTLSGPGLERWLPGFLAGLDGRTTFDRVAERLPGELRATALSLAQRLLGERIVVDGTAQEAHRPVPGRLAIQGRGPVRAGLRALFEPGPDTGPDTGPGPRVLCQDNLDYDAALEFGRRCRDAGAPWLWVSTGPMGRAYVGPLFLADVGPCLGCLLGHFRRLSPEPYLYDEIIRHAREGGEIPAVPFPAQALRMLEALAAWKIESMASELPPAALYRLHVLEAATMEIATHVVFPDPECGDCSA